MNFIIFDLEATCWSGNNLRKKQEIIEVGAVKLDAVGEYISQFQRFVRPFQNPQLSAYCTELTGIDQVDVNRASEFDFVARDFQDWIDVENTHYVLCSWGDKDVDLLLHDCQQFSMETDWIQSHADLKAQYHRIRRLKRKQGLRKTLDRESIEFDGSHHRALDDAINTAKLFVKYLDEWQY